MMNGDEKGCIFYFNSVVILYNGNFRWDVQRIREQRIIEKLKQRQERVGSNSRTEENLEPVQTLWPSADDIKFLEVSDHLPVSAFGVPIPKFTPRYFLL